MDTKELFLSALDSATEAVLMVKDSDFKKPTPDTEWDVKTLSAHMLYELAWVADVVNGLTIKEVGDKYDGDLIGRGLHSSWHEYEVLAKKAVRNCDPRAVAHLSWKDTSVDYYLKQMASDLLIHSWDLSAALLKPVRFDEDLAQAVYDNSYKDRMSGTASSMFKSPLKVADESDIQTKLLALFGRDIDWHR